MSEYSKEYYQKNKDKWKKYNSTPKYKKYQKEYNEIYNKKQKETLSEEEKQKARDYKKQYRLKNKDKINTQNKICRDKNKDKYNKQQRERNNKNKDKINAKKREDRKNGKYKTTEDKYKKDNIDKIREYNKLWKRNYRKTEKYKIQEEIQRNKPARKLHNNIARGIRSAIKCKKDKHTIQYLGCTITYFKTWIESQFYPNVETGEQMSWENQGSGWHIDHIIPKSIFNMENKTATLSCWNYKNLRPMWGKENISKYNNIEDVKYIYIYFLNILFNSHDFCCGSTKEE